MNIALILQHKLMLGIQRFIVGTPTPMPALETPLRLRSRALPRASAQRIDAARSNHTATVRHTAARVMPLRVLRMVESGQPRSSTGRLVISGRMADVCAELDRLVEREAAVH